MAVDQLSDRARLARGIIIDLAIMTAIGVALALIGPFGSFAMPLAARLVYWVGLGLAGYGLYRPIGALVARLGPALALPAAAMWALGCLLATVPMTAVVWLVGSLPRRPRLPTPGEAIESYGYVLVIGALATATFFLIERAREGRQAPAAPRPDPSPALPPPTPPLEAPAVRFLARLSPRLGTELIALEMEDHYVRAHTRAGSELILMRMRDAVAELDGLDGAQVHRSWWVARGMVRGTERDGRNLRLVLDSGLSAPVARAMVAPLRSRGWW